MPDLVANYGAPTNGKYRNDVALTIASGGTTLTAGTAIFTDGASEIGKLICFRNPNPANSAVHVTHITGFTSTTVVTLQDPSPFVMSAAVKPIAWGSSIDSAVAAWQAASQASPSGLTLTVPAGVFVGSVTHNINRTGCNCTIIGAGSSLTRFNQLNFSTGLQPQMVHGSPVRIHTAHAGDTSVVAKSAGLTSRLTVGAYVCVTGISTQANYGFPPTFEWQEYHKVTSIVGTTINFDTPLRFDYLETWPELDSCPVTITGLSPSDAVITLPEHGFSGTFGAGNVEFYLDTNGLGTMPGGLEGQEGDIDTAGTTWAAIVIDANTFKFAFQNNAPIKVTSAGSGLVLHRSGVEQGGPAMLYPMQPEWDVLQTISGMTVDPCPGVPGPGYAREIIMDDVNLPGGYGPTVMKKFTHKNSFIGSQSGTSEIDKLNEEIVYDNCVAEQLYYQNASITTISNSHILFLNGCGSYMTINNSHIDTLGQGISGTGINLLNRISNSQLDTVSAPASFTQREYQEFEPIPGDTSHGRFKIKLFAGNPYLNPRRFITMSVFIPGGWYFYAWSTGGVNPIGVPFQITSMYSDSTYCYFNTTLPVPQPNPDIFGGTGNPFLSNIQIVDGGTQNAIYAVYVPTQIAVLNNTGANPTLNAHEVIPFDVININPNPVHRGRIRVR